MPVPYHLVFTRQMPFLSPNQQHQSTEAQNSPWLAARILGFQDWEQIVRLKLLEY